MASMMGRPKGPELDRTLALCNRRPLDEKNSQPGSAVGDGLRLTFPEASTVAFHWQSWPVKTRLRTVRDFDLNAAGQKGMG